MKRIIIIILIGINIMTIGTLLKQQEQIKKDYSQFKAICESLIDKATWGEDYDNEMNFCMSEFQNGRDTYIEDNNL